MKARLNKNKTCKQCKRKFEQKQPLQYVCSLECSIDYAKELEEKRQNKEFNTYKKEIKEKHKTKGNYIKDLEAVFNAFIRERDKNLPCISCDALKGTYKYLRFNEDNVHGQCWFNCNKNQHGNINEYRIRLIKKIGLERVEKLDNDRHKRLELTIPELIELKVVYKEKLRKLKNGN